MAKPLPHKSPSKKSLLAWIEDNTGLTLNLPPSPSPLVSSSSTSSVSLPSSPSLSVSPSLVSVPSFQSLISPASSTHNVSEFRKAQFDESLRSQMCAGYPTRYEAAVKLAGVIIAPLLLQFGALLIPLQTPQPGFANNLVFLFAFVPYITLTAGVGNLGVVGMILGEPTRWHAIPLYCATAVAGCSILTLIFTSSYPPFLLNACVLAATLSGTFIPTAYMASPRRFTKELAKLLHSVFTYEQTTNGFFFFAITYIIGFTMLESTSFQVILTAFFHALAWGFQSACLRMLRGSLLPRAYHFAAIMWFQMVSEVFLMLTFPVVTSVFFYVVFAFKFLLLARFPLMLSNFFWDLSLSVRDSLDIVSKLEDNSTVYNSYPVYNVPKPLAKILWLFLPTSYSRGEFTHRVIISFSFTMYSYIIAPIYYIALSSWLRYGYNKDFYTYKDLSQSHFDLSLIYAGVSALGFSAAFVALAYFIKRKFGYNTWHHILYKVHNYWWYLIWNNHNAVTFTMLLLLRHLNVLYATKKYL